MTGESEFAHYGRHFRCSRADSPTATPRIQALWCGTTPTVHIAGHAEVHGDFSQRYIARQNVRLRLSGDQRDTQAYRNSNRHRPDPPLRGRWRHDRRVVCLTHRPGRQTGRMSWAITVNPRRLQGNREGRSCRERGRPHQHRTMRRNPSEGSDASSVSYRPCCSHDQLGSLRATVPRLRSTAVTVAPWSVHPIVAEQAHRYHTDDGRSARPCIQSSVAEPDARGQ